MVMAMFCPLVEHAMAIFALFPGTISFMFPWPDGAFRLSGWTRERGASPHAAGTVSVETACRWWKPVIGAFREGRQVSRSRHKSGDLRKQIAAALPRRLGGSGGLRRRKTAAAVYCFGLPRPFPFIMKC